MKILILTISLMLSFVAGAKSIYVDASRTQLVILCPQKKCLAKEAPLAKEFKTFKLVWVESGDNPSSSLCKHLNGNADIGYLENSDEISLCRFSDGSVAVGWDLFRLWQKN